LTGIITNIQRYSIHDGPGIRTVIFFKGCPLHCLWCCNPETQSFLPEIEFIKNLCGQCGKCIQVCEVNAVNTDLNCKEEEKINRILCTVCGKCAMSCPNQALRVIGEQTNVEEVMRVVLKDKSFFRRSGGGVTLSGGEPLSQPRFAQEILKQCHKNNIHTAIETCGAVSRKVYEDVISIVDLFLFDLKILDLEDHKRLTGAINTEILENLQWLIDNFASVILRLPLIPGINTSKTNLIEIVRLVKLFNIEEIHLMPFHQMGRDKYRHLGKTYALEKNLDMRLDEVGKRELFEAQRIFNENKIKIYVGG